MVESIFSMFFVPHVDQKVTERVILSCKCDKYKKATESFRP